MVLGWLVLRRDDDGGGGKLLGGEGRGLVVVAVFETKRGHEFDERRQCGHCSRRGRGREGNRCLGQPWKGREGVVGLLVLNGLASSSVGRHSGAVDCLGERWDDKRPGRQDNSLLASLLQTIRGSPPSLFLPISHESTTAGCQFPAWRLALHGPKTRNGVSLRRSIPSPYIRLGVQH